MNNIDKINIKARQDVQAIYNVLSKNPKIQKITILGAAITDKYNDDDVFFIAIDTDDIVTFIESCRTVTEIVDGTTREIDYINGLDELFYNMYEKELKNGVVIYENCKR